ncbi:hypothetical protein [Streptomyces sp. NBC_00259]|uniref:hypothetical protein n=1 Tax=Streptomyces sp. NBC_00259 TaxID=2903643 RepID=UPI002E2CD63A|nr:hypothetical protein [Streptomyces sp. NBC_00259]
MATENSKITEATNSNPESEREETPDRVPPREPLDKAPGEEEEHTSASDDADDDFPDTPADIASAGGFAAGAAAVVSAGLGICSLTGTSLTDMLRSRKELIGQIEASTGGGGDQINAFYSAPWHTAALVNGVFALAAVVIGGVLLALHAQRADTRPWVKSVALGGVIVGAIGLFIAGGMYLDLFASTPELPTSRPTG